MIITEKKLRRMIQNALLKEDEDLPPFVIEPLMDIESDGVFTSRDLPGGIPSYVTGDYKPSSGGMSAEEAQLYAEIMAGFTPAGVFVDAKDIAVALGEGDWWGAALATAGLIPGVGEAKKIKKLMDLKDLKKLDKVDQDALTNLKNNIENIKEVDPNELEKSIEKAQSVVRIKSRKLVGITKLGFKVFKPEQRHLKLIHGSSSKQLDIDPLAGRVTRQSRKGRPQAGFYAFPEYQSNLPSPEDTIARSKKYVSDAASKNPTIKNAHIHTITINPKANFVEQINPSVMGMTRISPGDAQKYKDAGIDIIVSKSMGLEEVIILNKDVISKTSVSTQKLN